VSQALFTMIRAAGARAQRGLKLWMKQILGPVRDHPFVRANGSVEAVSQRPHQLCISVGEGEGEHATQQGKGERLLIQFQKRHSDPEQELTGCRKWRKDALELRFPLHYVADA
jgi:hypothetical protein